METLEQMRTRWREEIRRAGAASEQEMRDATAPTLDTPAELAEYVRALVERPHDYGTCVYAMSLAATAAFNHVARKLGVTGFQASCADLDILSRTRGFKWGRLLNFDDLLYPQYRDKFPTWDGLLGENREELASRAKKLLAEVPDAHPNVRAHWQRLADAAP